jgi:hypothetical protein
VHPIWYVVNKGIQQRYEPLMYVHYKYVQRG